MSVDDSEYTSYMVTGTKNKENLREVKTAVKPGDKKRRQNRFEENGHGIRKEMVISTRWRLHKIDDQRNKLMIPHKGYI